MSNYELIKKATSKKRLAGYVSKRIPLARMLYPYLKTLVPKKVLRQIAREM